MANLSESPDWVAGIYQFEESDPVQGGAEGIDNLQAKQLANRTSYLKLLVEAAGNNMTAHLAAADPHAQYATELWVAAQIAALLDTAPGALDTLNELAAAMGDDANFAATMTNALALKAPLLSPLFTGAPTAPTPAQFDNDTSLATTAFVKASGKTYSSYVSVGGSTALTVAHAGALIGCASASAITITLPPISQFPGGASVTIHNFGTPLTIIRGGTDIMSADGSGVTSIQVPSGGVAEFTSRGDGATWMAAGSGVLSQVGSFNASLAAGGYQKLPSGLIIQWGTQSVAGSTTTTYTLPFAFPNAGLSIVANTASPGSTTTVPASFVGLTQFKLQNNHSAIESKYWIAIGY